MSTGRVWMVRVRAMRVGRVWIVRRVYAIRLTVTETGSVVATRGDSPPACAPLVSPAPIARTSCVLPTAPSTGNASTIIVSVNSLSLEPIATARSARTTVRATAVVTVRYTLTRTIETNRSGAFAWTNGPATTAVRRFVIHHA